MTSDLQAQIHDLMERGTHRLSALDAVGRQPAGPGAFPYKRSRGHGRLLAVGAGVTALACAGALTATQLGGSPGAARPATPNKAEAVLTTATLRHVANVTRLALARFGRAVVDSRETTNGALRSTSTDVITFSGKNWNQSLSETLLGIDGSPASAQSAINRVVTGQAYDFFAGIDGKRWYHVTGPDATSSLNIPDPRKLLAELAPAARFVVAGHSVLDGVAVTRLAATDPAALPALDNVQIWPGGTITAVTLWVDASGIVRQLTASGTQTVHGLIAGPGLARLRRLAQQVLAAEKRLLSTGHTSVAEAARIVQASPLGRELSKAELIKNSTTMTVSFTDIGQPQVIAVPAGAVTTSAVG